MKEQLAKLAIKATTTTARIVQITKVKSPTLLLVAGIVGVGVSAVLIGKASYKKVPEIMDHYDDKMESIESGASFISEKELAKDLLVCKVQTAWDFVEAYAIPVALGTVSIGCLIWSHNILMQRNQLLLSSYIALNKAFQKYRENVIAEQGNAADARYKLGVKKVVDSEGKVSYDYNPDNNSMMFSRFVYSDNGLWNETGIHMFLHAAENTRLHLQRRFDRKGHLFMNEVYEALQIEQTKPGAINGWSKIKGDTEILFGEEFYRLLHNEEDLATHPDDCVLFDFNLSGEILSTFEPEYVRAALYGLDEKGTCFPAQNELA
jgi:hypothetical protein